VSSSGRQQQIRTTSSSNKTHSFTLDFKQHVSSGRYVLREPTDVPWNLIGRSVTAPPAESSPTNILSHHIAFTLARKNAVTFSLLISLTTACHLTSICRRYCDTEQHNSSCLCVSFQSASTLLIANCICTNKEQQIKTKMQALTCDLRCLRHIRPLISVAVWHIRSQISVAVRQFSPQTSVAARHIRPQTSVAARYIRPYASTAIYRVGSVGDLYIAFEGQPRGWEKLPQEGDGLTDKQAVPEFRKRQSDPAGSSRFLRSC
jgi:hypothetical protein